MKRLAIPMNSPATSVNKLRPKKRAYTINPSSRGQVFDIRMRLLNPPHPPSGYLWLKQSLDDSTTPLDGNIFLSRCGSRFYPPFFFHNYIYQQLYNSGL